MPTLAQTLEYGPLVAQFGFGGALLWIMVKWMESVIKLMERILVWMERTDHTLRGLSKALWMDLASRDCADRIVRDHAKQMVSRLEEDERKPRP